MRVIALLLLLAGSNIAFSSPSASAGSDGVAQGLPEWLESVVNPSSSTGVAEASLPAHQGRHIERDYMCLQASTQTTCATYGLMRSNVGCCEPEHQAGHDRSSDTAFDIAQQALRVGVCTWSLLVALEGGNVDLTPNVLAAGSTTLSCTLTKAAEECGPAGCGDLTLTAQLDTYVVNVAIVEGDATGALTLDDVYDGPGSGCRETRRRQGSDRKEVSPRMPAFKESPFKRLARNKTQARQGDPTTLVTVAFETLFMSGPVTVSSKTHNARWEAGWVNFIVPEFFVSWDEQALQALENDYGPLPKLSAKDIGKLKFQFFRPDERY